MLTESDQVSLRDLRVDCVVGLLPQERNTHQTILVDAILYLERRPNLFGDAISTTVDYSVLAGVIRFVIIYGKFRLLETAIEAIAHVVLGPPAVDRSGARPLAVDLTLRKPGAIPAAVAAVSVRRFTDELHYSQELNHYGLVQVLSENRDCSIVRLCIPPKTAVPAHYHPNMEEAELVMSDGFLLQGKPVTAGLAHEWPQNFVHCYFNDTEEERSLLCLNRPNFDPEEEVILFDNRPATPVPTAARVAVSSHFSEACANEKKRARSLESTSESKDDGTDHQFYFDPITRTKMKLDSNILRFQRRFFGFDSGIYHPCPS